MKKKKKKLKLKKKFKVILLFIITIIIFLILKFNNITLNNKITKPLINDNKEIYLALNDTYYINNNYENIKWSSSNNEIANISKGIVTPKKSGLVTITAELYGKKEIIKFNISDLFNKAIIDNDKTILACNQYTKDENIYLDKVLKNKIENAGYKTRAGAVAAARFLALEFKYRIAYFYENGRLSNDGSREYVDGEGRYYHIGLYLHESKIEDIVASSHGPAIWGCNIYTKTLEMKTPNGLDCSGFVSWLLLNAGFDVGDIGAGFSKDIKDLSDLGPGLDINKENLEKREFKVGDLFSRDGHIGILIGMDEEKYYVAEALDYDLHVNTYTMNELLNTDWQYIILMEDLYKEDGNLTNMW